MTNRNSTEYWNWSWLSGRKKFPKYTMKVIRDLVPEGSEVLEIGCGYGKLLKWLKDYKNCDVYGVDISDVAINEAKEKFGIEGEICNAEDLVLKVDKKFDVVIASHLLEHLDNDEEFISRCSKLLKPKGVMVVAVPDNCSYPDETGEHVRKYNAQSLTALLVKYFYELENHSYKNHLIFRAKI